MADLDVTLRVRTTNTFTDSPTEMINSNNYTHGQDAVLKKVLLTADTGKLIFEANEYGRSFLYIKNINSGDFINIEDSGSTTIYASLAKAEFAFIPWNGTVDLYAKSIAANGVIEVGIFEV
jgi:hypothetical protein